MGQKEKITFYTQSYNRNGNRSLFHVAYFMKQTTALKGNSFCNLPFIVDRIKNMIIRSDGFKVFPLSIEKYILMHPAVETCKVIGVQDPNFNKGMVPKVFIVLKNSVKDSREKILNEIKELCITNLPEYQILVDYAIREELPLTGIGKIDMKALEAAANDN